MKYLEKQHLVFFFCCVLMASMIYSPFLLSVSMFALAVLCLVKFKISKTHFSLSIDLEAILRMFRIYRYPSFVAVTLFFFIVLLSFWQTYDYDYWQTRLRIKIPFLVFPLMFLALPRFTEQQIKGLFYCLLLMLTITGLGIMANYFLHMEEINILMKKGQPMPTPRNHIRLSLLMAIGIVAGGYLYREHFIWRYSWERKLIATCTIFLFFCIHLLSVRTGLLALYAAIFILIVRHIYVSRNWRHALIALAVVAITPVLAFYTLPSLRAKIDYMKYDYFMYRHDRGNLYADSGRLTSLKVGWEIWRDHPVFGVGAGNLRDEVTKRFTAEHPKFAEPHMPHNQFLFVAAGMGIVGLGLFIFAFFYPLFYHRNYRHPVLLAFYTTAFLAFMIEHSIENSIGVGFFAFFLLLFLNHLNRTPENEAT